MCGWIYLDTMHVDRANLIMCYLSIRWFDLETRHSVSRSLLGYAMNELMHVMQSWFLGYIDCHSNHFPWLNHGCKIECLQCLDVFIHEFYSNMHAIDTSVPHFTMIFHGTHIVVILELISDVLRVPRVDHPNYPNHRHLSSISRDELASLFCEKAMLWGGTLNFSTIEFAKGTRILNMVMIFVLTSRSHYNTITHDSIFYRLLSRHSYTW